MTAAAPDRAAFAAGLVKAKEDGRVKMFLTRQALAFRRRRRALFEQGEYRPMEGRGPLADHVCAVARVGPDGAAVTLAPRRPARRGADGPPLGAAFWADARLEGPPGLGAAFVDVLTGERLEARRTADAGTLAVGAALASFPVALLPAESP
jgi:(1->4)-alpha-D-glucan 1-alpha-D-glucosylmutase